MTVARVIAYLARTLGTRSIRHFNAMCKLPGLVQLNLFKHIVQYNQQTQFGKDHNFKEFLGYYGFHKNMPICSYDYLKPYIDAAFHGKPNQLTVKPPVFYATTSGTTGKPKHIPVTRENKKAKASLLQFYFVKLLKDHPKVFDGRILAMVSPEGEDFSPTGVPVGSESGHGFKNAPILLQNIVAAPYEVFAMKDYEAKYYSLVRISANYDVSLIYTVNPSTVLLLAQRLGQYTEKIIRDIHDGTLSAEFDIPGGYRDAFSGITRKNMARARFLEQAADKNDGVLLPKHIWPNLSCICCWKGGSLKMYTDRFSEYFSEETPVRDVGFFASEMRASVPIDDTGSDGVLAIGTNCYEFYPAGQEKPPTGNDLIPFNELEVGKQYYIYVTTSSGLYRYDMNDIIEVTGMYYKTPKIRFVQKGKGVVSFTGEKLYENQVISAVSNAMGKTAVKNHFIAAVGCSEGRDIPQYKFLIEFSNKPDRNEGITLAIKVEKELEKLNIEYEAKRKSNRLAPLIIRVIAPNEFDAYRKRQVEDHGRTDGQFKTLKLTRDEKFMGEFKSIGEFEAEE